MQELAKTMTNNASTSSIEDRNVCFMQLQLAVYTDIVLNRFGDDVAMCAKVMLMDEVMPFSAVCLDLVAQTCYFQ